MNNKKFYPTALALYFTYFVNGIGVSILSQYKSSFAETWGATQLADGSVDVSMVVSVIAALGLGRLISLPFSGPISDRFGRRISGIIGVLCYAGYFLGITMAPSMGIAYVFAILGGVANSFLDTCVTPTCLEIFTKSGSVANLFTKFSMVVAQFLLPFMIGWVAAANMSYKTIFIVTAVAILIDGALILFLPFPARNSAADNKEKKQVVKEKMKFTPTAIAAILIGFTSTTTFQLWLNCNQELGASYGLSNPSIIQSYYSVGTILAILCSSVLIKKGLKEVNILVIYPTISVVMLLICYFVQSPTICLIGGFVVGFAAAGGVLQLAVSTTALFFPANKGKATSLVMIASSAANYTILTLAGYITKVNGASAPRMILLLNVVVTVIGVVLALYVKAKMKNKPAAA